MQQPIRILLADDHALVRAGLRALLEKMSGVAVVAEAGDGLEALRLIGETSPDLALLDISMPALNGLDVAMRVREKHPATRVIMISFRADDDYVRRALAAGAAGYLLKDSGPAELELAVRAVAGGETWLSPAVASRLVKEFVGRERRAVDGPFEVLTSRQREVLQMIAEGLSSKEIAGRLDVSVKTVETHRNELMDRLGIRGVAGLVRYAVRAGLVDASG